MADREHVELEAVIEDDIISRDCVDDVEREELNEDGDDLPRDPLLQLLLLLPRTGVE